MELRYSILVAHPSSTSLPAQDPGQRGIASLFLDGELAAAASSLTSARSVAILTGYPCCLADPPTETDGPLGALAIARALVPPRYLSHPPCSDRLLVSKDIPFILRARIPRKMCSLRDSLNFRYCTASFVYTPCARTRFPAGGDGTRNHTVYTLHPAPVTLHPTPCR